MDFAIGADNQMLNQQNARGFQHSGNFFCRPDIIGGGLSIGVMRKGKE